MSFYKYISEYYDRIFPFSLKKEDFFRPFFEGSPGYLLDIGCATGELAFFAGESDWNCTGIDNDDFLLAIAEKKSKEKRSKINFKKMDMKECGRIFNNGSFDIVTCMGNTLVHLDSYGEIHDLAGDVFRILKNGGIFTGQIMNYKKILKTGKADFPVYDDGEIKFIRNYDFQDNEKRIKFHMEIGERSAKKFFTSEVFLYPLISAELRKILTEAGFKSFKFYGNFEGDTFTMDSSTLVFKAEKG